MWVSLGSNNAARKESAMTTLIEEEPVVVVKAGLVLAFPTPSGKLRLPCRHEIGGLVIMGTADNGVVTACTGVPDGCIFVPAVRLQADMSDEESDKLADALLNSAGRK
jgi:hypothetical protein